MNLNPNLNANPNPTRPNYLSCPWKAYLSRLEALFHSIPMAAPEKDSCNDRQNAKLKLLLILCPPCWRNSSLIHTLLLTQTSIGEATYWMLWDGSKKVSANKK